jgi:CRISPR/Cas system CMR subunit Cmr4 (Cas7 group RAMP superfamily)
MKNFNEFNRLNEERSPEETLLNNLFNFYYKKHKSDIDKVESEFLKAAKDLLDEKEISKKSFDSFLDSKGINTATKVSIPKKVRNKFDDDDYSSFGTSNKSYC